MKLSLSSSPLKNIVEERMPAERHMNASESMIRLLFK
jgi:hypothetical protein